MVYLHSINDSNKNDLNTQTLRTQRQPDADNQVEFDDLPLGEYGVLANSSNYTGTSNRNLTKFRPHSSSSLTLYTNASLSGNIVNEAGEGIPDAKIFIASYITGGNETDVDQMRSRLSAASSASDGSFVIQNLQKRDIPLQYRLLVHATGYVNTVTEYYEPGSTGISFTQGPATNVVHSTTDEQGNFVVGSLATGEYTVGIDDDFLVAASESSTLMLDDFAFNQEQRIEVTPGGIVEGRIYNVENDTGIPNVTLRAYPRRHNGPQRTAESQVSGHYQIAGLVEGPYEVRFDEIEGYPKNLDRDDRKNLSASPGHTVSGIDFPLKQGLLVSGRVVDEKGEPVDVATVDASELSGGTYEYDRSDERGRFTIAGMAPNTDIRLRGRKQGYASLAQLLNTGEDGLTGVVVKMVAESKISGTVMDGFGNPKPLMEMYARITSGPNAQVGSPIESADAQGKFVLDGLVAGEYNIFVYNNGSHSNTPAETVTVKAGEHKEDVRIVIEEVAGESISGIVVNTEGDPVRYVDLSLQGPGWASADTDAAGKFKFTGVNEGTYTIALRAGNYMSQSVPNVSAGMNNLRIVIEHAGTIRGRVLSAATREPIQDFSIKLTNATPYFVKYFETYHHKNGEYSVGDVNGSTATLTVRADGYAEQDIPITGVLPGEVRENTDIYLESGNSLTGTVLTSDGSPVAGADIFLGTPPRNSYDRERNVRATSDTSDEFTVDSLAVGEATITAYHARYAQQTVTADIRPGDGNGIDIILTAGATVEGTVDSNGEPLSGVRLSVSGQLDGQWFHENAATNSDGEYKFTGLPEGVFSLSVNTSIGGQQRSTSQQVQSTNELVTEANFSFQPGNSTIEGYIFVADGETSGGSVSLSVDTGFGTEGRHMEIKKDQAYRFEGLPAGEITLRAWGTNGGSRNKQAHASLGDNETLRLDLVLFGGGTVRAAFANVQEGRPAYVLLLNGTHDIPQTVDAATVQNLSQSMAGNAQIVNGTAEITSLDPGDYTLIAVMYEVDSNGQPILPADKVTGTTLSITTPDEVKDVSLSF